MRHDLVRKLSQHSVYEQVGRRKLGHEPIRHGRFIIIVDRGKIAFKKIRAGGSARYTLFQLFGMAALNNIPKTLIEVAEVEGASA